MPKGNKRAASRSKSGGKSNKGRCPSAAMTRLAQPFIPVKELSEFRYIKLSNGLRALLISSPEGVSNDPDWTHKFPTNCWWNSLTTDNKFPDLPSYIPNFRQLSCGCGDDDNTPERRKLAGHGLPSMSISITIKAGSHADPLDFPGLAHFTEHIVHHGTTTYPRENEFTRFIQNAGGQSNAFTDKCLTNYHAILDSSKNNISEICHRYVSLLSEPLCNVDVVTREIESVDNEYYLRKVSLFFRSNFLIHRETVEDPEHPLRKFSIGSKESLMHPNVANSNIQLSKASLRFVKTNYYAHNMGVVLQTSESLDYMEKCVVEAFSKVQSKSSYPAEKAKAIAGKTIPYHKKRFNRLFTAKPLDSDGHILFLSWAMQPSIWKNYKEKTIKYLTKIFSHEAPGGLKHYLCEKGYIIWMGVTGEGGFWKNEYVTLFQMMFLLTQEGRDSLQLVIESIFSYIKLHQNNGAKKDICDEMERLESVHFQVLEVDKSVQQCVRMSEQILYCETQDVVVGQETPNGVYNLKQITECLKKLTPANANYFLFTSDANTETYLIENIYGTNYIIQDLPKDILRRLEQVEIYKEFQGDIPYNPFATESIKISNDEAIEAKHLAIDSDKVCFVCDPYPAMASQQSRLILRAFPGILPKMSRANRPGFDIVASLLKIEILPKLHHQVALGFSGTITSSYFGGWIQFYACGFERGGTLEALHIMLNTLEDFPNKVTEKTFNIAKECVLQSYFNSAVEAPLFALELITRLKLIDNMTGIECYDRMCQMTFVDFQIFAMNLKKQIYFLLHVEGFIQRVHIRELLVRLEHFRCGCVPPLTCFQIMTNQGTQKLIPKGERCLRVKSIMPEEKIFFVVNHYQMGRRDDQSDIMVRIIYNKILRDVYHELRTKQQLGYVVGARLASDEVCNAIQIYVAGHVDKHSPCYVNSRIDHFLSKFLEYKLTLERLEIILRNTDTISCSPDRFRDFFEKNLVSAKSKLSVQIMTCRAVDECLCRERNNSSPCNASQWMAPVTRIGKERLEISFGTELEDAKNTGKYFISSIEEYHRS